MWETDGTEATSPSNGFTRVGRVRRPESGAPAPATWDATRPAATDQKNTGSL
jgi:hypothetical protein